ncbi:Uncharacterised protein [Bordetella pertussis]|nr:Uncharacterised protein [Bordetella pertussis]
MRMCAASATCAWTSANASFMASIRMCWVSGCSAGRDARSKCSTIPSAIRAARPCPLGGSWCNAWPR